jgi:hypothetical protein
MSLPETTLAGMRKTNDLFCSTVVRLRTSNCMQTVAQPRKFNRTFTWA